MSRTIFNVAAFDKGSEALGLDIHDEGERLTLGFVRSVLEDRIGDDTEISSGDFPLKDAQAKAILDRLGLPMDANLDYFIGRVTAP